ncbi:hypothetical protein EDD99_8115 [Streptomyces sp. 846.5]|nr:hypothetical protein [Streptomyces sp. 846.5]TDT93306.1 hypothetical protein EDD99_8115 [Streptomyces sp. 846.5]
MPRQRQADDADPLISPAEFARLLGHTDTTTVSHWVKGRNTPAGWPAPDDWVELSTRRRPMWRRSTAERFAAVDHRAPGAQPGQFHGTRHVHQAVTDPRAIEIAGWLDAVDAGTREPVTRQQVEAHFEVKDHTARRLLARARTLREEQP